MGVLDDAIREHLELKRQHGAREDEVKELEDEAFGPPSRPGDPDFPARETGEGDEPGAGVAVEEPLAAEHEPAQPPEDPAPTELLDEPIMPKHERAAPPESEPAESQTAEQVPAEPEPAGESRGGEFFDQALEEDLGVDDLDLKLDETEDVLPTAPDPAPEPEERVEEAELIEDTEAHPLGGAGQPTEEHAFPGELEDESEELPLELDDESGETAVEPAEETGEDDVLEETPEFLRDAPENEELWFEQGEPQDFDFEDEDDK